MKKILTWAIFAFAAVLSLSCTKNDGDDFDFTPRVVCSQGLAGTALLNESVSVSILNVAETTVSTIKFGKEKTLTLTGPGRVSYAFTTEGTKTITVTTSPEEIAKTTYKVYVEKMESLQSLAATLKKNPNLCLVMCHRANTSNLSIPENSAMAVEQCITEKVDIVENDVYTTKDGVLVVSHDATINRVTNGSGTIRNLTLQQIKSYDLKDRNGKVVKGQKMLTFDEYLKLCKGRIYINVDIGDRDASVTQVVQEIAANGMTQQVLVYCNSKDKITEAYKANPECNVYSWVSNAQHLLDGGLKDYSYFTQCSWNPQTKDCSANGKIGSLTSVSSVTKAKSLGTIITVNALPDSSDGTLYKDNFTKAQAENLFATFGSCQCIHGDVGKEMRDAIVAAGRQVLNK